MLLVVAQRGKPPTFTPEQSVALRKALEEMRQAKGWTQAQLGDKIGVAQQNASRVLKSGNFGYINATKAARLLGYIGIDAFFEARSVALPRVAADVDPARDTRHAVGMHHARSLGVSERAIELVNRRVDKVNFYSSRWWCTQYLNQQEALDDASRAPSEAISGSEAPTSAAEPPSVRAVRRRRRAKTG